MAPVDLRATARLIEVLNAVLALVGSWPGRDFAAAASFTNVLDRPNLPVRDIPAGAIREFDALDGKVYGLILSLGIRMLPSSVARASFHELRGHTELTLAGEKALYVDDWERRIQSMRESAQEILTVGRDESRRKQLARINEGSRIRSEAKIKSLTGQLGVREPPRQPAVPQRIKRKADRATETRDRWIYEQCCKGVPFDTIAILLKRKPKSWPRISTKQGIQQAGIRYAKRHDLELPPPRQDR